MVGEFNAWNPELHPLEKKKNGQWKATLFLPRSNVFKYAFYVDGKLLPDPKSPTTEDNSLSILTIPGDRNNEVSISSATGDQKQVAILLQEMKKDLSAIRNSLHKTEKRLKDYRHRLQAKDATITSLRKQLSNQRAEKIRNEEKRINLKSEMKVLKNERKKLRNNQKSLQNQIEQLKTDKKQLQNDLNDMQDKYNNLLSERPKKEQLKQIKNERDELKIKLKKLRKKLKQLKDSTRDKETESSAANKKSQNQDQKAEKEAKDTTEESDSSENSWDKKKQQILKESEAFNQEKNKQPSNEDQPTENKSGESHKGSILYISPEKNTVAISLFKKHGISEGSKVHAYRNDEKLGTLKVSNVFGPDEGAFSFCTPEDSSLLEQLQEGDTIHTQDQKAKTK